MIKRTWFLICLLLFYALKTHSVFGEGIAVPRFMLSPLPLVISTAEDPGPFYTVTPETLFQRGLYIGYRYVYSDFKTCWGVELDELFGQWTDWLSGENHVNFTSHIHQITAAYGITNRFLVGVMVPWKRISFSRDWEGSDVRNPGGLSDRDQGIGDVVLSTRYRIFRELESIIPVSWAVELDIKFATGSDHRIDVAGASVGTGEIDYKVVTMLSKQFSKQGLRLYCSLGYSKEGRDRASDNMFLLAPITDTLEYNLAVVVPITISKTTSFSLSAEILGLTWVNWEAEPFRNIVDTRQRNTYDLGVGMKLRTGRWNVEVGSTFPLNYDGVRAGLQPTIGISYEFK